MNSKLLPLALSIVLGLIAVIAVNRHISSLADPAAESNAELVIYAKKALPRGTPIAADVIEERRVPSEFLTLQMVRASDREHLEGHKTTVDVDAGQPILWSITDLAGGSDFANTIKPNHRAITVPIQGAGGASSLLEPGDRVDVVSTYSIPDLTRTNPQMVTQMLIQDVTVLAVDARTQISANVLDSIKGVSVSQVTLQVSPQQALELALAKEQTTLDVLIRNPADVVQHSYTAITLENLASNSSEPRDTASADRSEPAAPVPGYPVIVEQGRTLGSAFYPRARTSSQTTPTSTDPGLNEVLTRLQGLPQPDETTP